MVYFQKSNLSLLWGHDIINISIVLCYRTMKISEIIKVWREKWSFTKQSKVVCYVINMPLLYDLNIRGVFKCALSLNASNYISVFINTFSSLFPNGNFCALLSLYMAISVFTSCHFSCFYFCLHCQQLLLYSFYIHFFLFSWHLN